MNKIPGVIKVSKALDTKAVQRLNEKTQVVSPKNGREEVVKNRFSHSIDVMTSASIMVNNLDCSIVVDYQDALPIVSLLHDIGHPAFGHEGQKTINQFFKEKGLSEGFDDNNNNLVIIEKEQIELESYDFASLIKYPTRLYDNQNKFLNMLENAIKEDIMHFEKHIKIYQQPTRTVVCEIMDEADRNSYVCSDLTDFYSLGWGGDSKELEEILESNKYSSFAIKEFLYSAIAAIKNKDKALIKRVFNNLKLKLNENFILSDNLKLINKNEELFLLREELYRIEDKIFIKSPEIIEQKKVGKEMLITYMNYVFENKFYPSRTYKKLIENSSGERKLRFMRDMIAETTDWYVYNFIKKLG